MDSSKEEDTQEKKTGATHATGGSAHHGDEDAARGITRRSLVAGAAGFAALFAFGGATRYAFAGDESVVYPPGAGDVDAFWGLCVRCDRCRSACPQGAIGVAKIEDGLLQMRLPKMEYRLGYCDGCDGEYRCVAACPTGALSAFDATHDKIGMAVVDEASCQLYTYSHGCSKQCMDYCPAEGALYLDDEGMLHVNEEACWGCGICEYVCPTNAYRSYDGNPSRGINVKPWIQGGAQ